MHIENDFTVELRAGRIFVNGIEHQSVVDVGRRLYTTRTTMKFCEELQRVIGQALKDGSLIPRAPVQKPAKLRRGVRYIGRTES